MRFHFFILISILVFTFGHCPTAIAAGNLLAIGGALKSKEIYLKMIELANGGSIVVIPLASDFPVEAFEAEAKEFSKYGYHQAEGLEFLNGGVDGQASRNQIKNASLVYLTGGDQVQLLKALQGTEVLRILSDRNCSENLHVAGSSAGEVSMSERMITGKPLPPFEKLRGIRPNMVEVITGFGLVKNVMLDMHFLKRTKQARWNRLLSALLDQLRNHPDLPPLVGIGADEDTSILFDQDRKSFQVIGERAVMIIDPRNAQFTVSPHGYYFTKGLQVKLLLNGDVYLF